MNIDELITNVKKKIKKNINIENIFVEDKTFLHKNHTGHESNKFHLKITLESEELKKLNKIESNKKIYKILDKELKNHIHSLQILIN
ncbi:BolA family transcriptional regulator [Candidatus Pelagibacter sp.]|nr:BolA family transcriptional regulator [Candidatus Pelagibacter sp.]